MNPKVRVICCSSCKVLFNVVDQPSLKGLIKERGRCPHIECGGSMVLTKKRRLRGQPVYTANAIFSLTLGMAEKTSGRDYQEEVRSCLVGRKIVSVKLWAHATRPNLTYVTELTLDNSTVLELATSSKGVIPFIYPIWRKKKGPR